MMEVFATREGEVGKLTASGWTIDSTRMFVALPSEQALTRWVHLRNPLNGKECNAEVLDVGPWSEEDDQYVFNGQRPLAEIDMRVMYHGTIEACKTNRAGIDLGEAVWRTLGMKDNGPIQWEFIKAPQLRAA